MTAWGHRHRTWVFPAITSALTGVVEQAGFCSDRRAGAGRLDPPGLDGMESAVKPTSIIWMAARADSGGGREPDRQTVVAPDRHPQPTRLTYRSRSDVSGYVLAGFRAA